MQIIQTASFFKKIQDHYNANLPFVVYKKPDQDQIRAILQTDTSITYSDALQEKGFVFAPFLYDNNAILLKSTPQNTYTTTLEDAACSLPKPVQKKQLAHNKEHHVALLEKALQKIATTALQKVVLSREETLFFQEDVDVLAILKQLFALYPNAFSYIWHHPLVGTWLGASPETLLEVSKNTFTTMSLAGTQPFMADKKSVHWGIKEIEEQDLVTQYIITHLKSKGIAVSKGATITQKAGNLLHLKTPITGDISKHDIASIVKVLHPTPAVCGMPLTLATDFILKQESYHRAYYTGFLGPIHLEQQSSIYVNLRCMQIQKNKAVLYVGGGITKASIPDKEWQETKEKTKTMKKALGL